MSTTDNSTIGQYKLVNCIASGQHSQVWEAVDGETTRRVALKLLLPEALKDSEQLGALKHEFKVGSSFEHPNIIKYYTITASRKQAYFAMELFPSPNLKTWAYNDLRGVHIRFKRLVELVAMGLEHIHEQGWLHRDIKPDNLLMNKSAEVRIVDFSLASRAASMISKVFSRKQATVKGTRTYMAPEQILGRPLTRQTDIYNFGVTLFELLTGQAPFAGSTPKNLLLMHINQIPPNPSQINENVTPEMDRIVQRMLSKKPEQRQKKMSEFLVEFRNVAVFKEEVTEAPVLSEREQADEALKKVLGGALDSRADAMRTKFGGPTPEAPLKKPKP
ncbi:MAG: serine/threonine protein kinase, partial [Planctomycetales bacterium]